MSFAGFQTMGPECECLAPSSSVQSSSTLRCCGDMVWPAKLYVHPAVLSGTPAFPVSDSELDRNDDPFVNLHCHQVVNQTLPLPTSYNLHPPLLGESVFCRVSDNKFCYYTTDMADACNPAWCLDILSCSPFHAAGEWSDGAATYFIEVTE